MGWSYFDSPGSYSAVNNDFGGGGDYFSGSSPMGGNEMGGYAAAVGGGTQALVGLLMGNKQMKYQKRINSLQRQQTRDQFKNQMKDSSIGEIGTQRTYQRGLPDVMAQLSAQGQGNSSAANLARDDAKYALNLRLNSIQRERALAVSGMKAQEEIWKLQYKMARAQQQSAAIAAGIDTAISVASIVSDQRIKRNFGPVESQDVLSKLDTLPISTWTYAWERDEVKHMGPMAQDFYKLFGLGHPIQDRPAAIAWVDLFGVLLASVKALSARVKELEANQIRR